MSLFSPIYNALKNRFVRGISDVELSMLVRERFDNKASAGIVPMYIPQRKVTLSEWEASIEMAKNPYVLNRFQLYRIYDSAMLDLHLEAVIQSRIKKAQTAKFRLVDADGNEDPVVTQLFHTQWFRDFIKYSIEAEFYGFSLIELSEQSPESKTVKTNKGTFTFNPLTEVTLIDRQHVRPEFGTWTVNAFDLGQNGFSYKEHPSSMYYIPVGKPKELGLLAKIAPVAIAKRYSQGAWSEYNEKLGIPFRTVKMQGVNKERERLLANVLTNMGSAGWAILHPGEEIQLLQAAGTDVHKCFLEMADFCDKQMSKAVLGQTMTTDDGGSLSQAKVHKEVGDDWHESDRISIEYAVNEFLIPRLNARNYPTQGYLYERYDAKEESLDESVKKDELLFKYFNISPEYVSQKYGVPIEQITSKTEPTAIQEPKPKADMHFNPDMLLPKYEIGCCKKNWLPVTMQEAESIGGQYVTEIEKLYQKFYNGDTVEQVPASAALEYLKPLLSTYMDGLGYQKEKPTYNSPDNLRLAMAEANIARFSTASTFHDVVKLNELARKAGSFKVFKDNADAYTKAKTFRLKTEYDTAFAIGQSAAAFTRQIAQADEFDLQYNTIMDERVRQSHAALEGFTAPVEDPIWNTIYPPNGWNCRCEVVQVVKGSVPLTATKPDTSDKVILKGFRFNPGKSYTVFENSVSYLKDFFPNEKLNPKVYGLLTSEKYLNQDRSNLPSSGIPKWGKKEFQNWWDTKAKDDGNVYLKNHLGLSLYLSKDKLYTKFDKFKYNGENRHGIANALENILQNPDEIWVQYNTSPRVKYRAAYIASFQEGVYAAVVQVDNTSELPPLEVITWYQINDASSLGTIRNGLLLTKKAEL